MGYYGMVDGSYDDTQKEMITDIILYVVGSFVALIAEAFKLINFAIPSQFVDASNYFISKLSYLSGFINVSDILSAVGWFLTFTTYWYSIKLVLWVFSLIPWFGKNISPKL